MKRVMIDPGHGGRDPGAVGPGGLEEKSVALDVAQALWAKMVKHPGLMPKLTRDGDDYVSLGDRAAASNAYKADLFISIHCNASESHLGTGYEVWTSPGNTSSDRAATLAFNRYQAAFPHRQARVSLGDGDPDKEARFTVLMKTRGPALLFELEFIDNSEGEEFLALTNPGVLADPLYQGALDFFDLVDPVEEGEKEKIEASVNLLEILEMLQMAASGLKSASQHLDGARAELSKAWRNL